MQKLYEDIETYLRFSPTPQAVHEIKIPGVTQNNLATRISEMAKLGRIVGHYRKGKSFKEWTIAKYDGQQGVMI